MAGAFTKSNITGQGGGSGGTYVALNYNANSTKSKKGRVALGKVRDKTGNCKVLVIADSTGLGYGAVGGAGYNAGGRAKNFIVKLADMFNSYFLPARADAVIGCGAVAAYTTFDSRFAVTSFTQNTVLDGCIGNVWFSTTNTGKVAFTPTTAFDSAQVWYAQAGAQGTFTIDVDGGAALATINATGANALVSSTVTPALATHTLNVTKTNATSNYILGFRTWNSTVSQVEFIQACWAGAFASNFITAANPWDALNQITNIAPDITIIDCSINDAVNATSMGTYTANIQTIITACLASGTVILSCGVPSAISQQTLAIQQTYIDALAALAVTNGIIFVDQWRRWESYEISNPIGLYSDVLHPNGPGYSDYAQGLYEVLINL